MASNLFPLSLGQQSTNGALAPLLGELYTDQVAAGARTFVLCQAAANIAAPARKIVVSAISGGLPTWVFNTTTTAGAGPAAVIPAEYGSTAIASGAYFLAQIDGPAEVLSAAAVAAFALVGTSATAGKADDATITGAAVGYALEAAAGADENLGVMLRK